MHYVPETAHDFLPDERSSGGRAVDAERSFHYQSAPLYLLTLAVGALLGADLFVGMVNDPSWSAYREPLGFRLRSWRRSSAEPDPLPYARRSV